jgi:hypothetical protein
MFEAEVFLQGGLIAGKELPISGGSALQKDGVWGLNGKTIILSSPAAETVTFVASPAIDQAPVTMQEIRTQIEVQTTGVVVRWFGRRLVLIEASPSSGVVIDGGTALGDLGLALAAIETQSDFVFDDDAGGGDSTVTTTAGDFLAAGLVAGHTVFAVGGANDGNSGVIRSLTDKVVTMVGTVFVDETLGTPQSLKTASVTGQYINSDGSTVPYLINISPLALTDGAIMVVTEE